MNVARPVIAAALVLPALLGVAPAHATPLPAFCAPSTDDVCTTRLTSVTADAVNGTITGTPVGADHPVTLAGQGDAYLRSSGFGEPIPEVVQSWDDTIERVNALNVDPQDPSWYGNAKSRVFMPRTLNELATGFPSDTLVVAYAPEEAQPGALRLVSIQPSRE